MKKILFLLVIGGALFIASCTKQYNVVQPNQTFISDPIDSTAWTTTDGGKNYQVNIDMTNKLGDYENSNDAVIIALTFDNGAQYEQIPEVYNNKSFTYTYSKGIITVYAQSADGTQFITPPPAFRAKIVLVDSQ
jgi:hypothetical protein